MNTPWMIIGRTGLASLFLLGGINKIMNYQNTLISMNDVGSGNQLVFSRFLEHVRRKRSIGIITLFQEYCNCGRPDISGRLLFKAGRVSFRLLSKLNVHVAPVEDFRRAQD